MIDTEISDPSGVPEASEISGSSARNPVQDPEEEEEEIHYVHTASKGL